MKPWWERCTLGTTVAAHRGFWKHHGVGRVVDMLIDVDGPRILVQFKSYKEPRWVYARQFHRAREQRVDAGPAWGVPAPGGKHG